MHLQNLSQCLQLPPAEMAQLVFDYNQNIQQQEMSAERYVSLIQGMERLSPNDRRVVIDYLKQDDTIAQYAGEDPDRYYDNLKESCEFIAEIIGAGVIGAIGGTIAAWFLHKYRDSFHALRKTLSNNHAMTNEDLSSNTTSRIVLSYDVFKRNVTVLDNSYRATIALLKKSAPKDEDFLNITNALGIKIKRPPRPGTGEIIGGFFAGVLVSIGTAELLRYLAIAPIIGSLLAAGWVSLPALMALSFTSNYIMNFGGVFLGLRTQQAIMDREFTSKTFVDGGWDYSKVEWARKQCLNLIKYMDNVAAQLQNWSTEDKQAAQAARKLIDIQAAAVQGMCISTARMLD